MIGFAVLVAVLAYVTWRVGEAGEIDRDTGTLYRDGERAGRIRAERMKEDGVEALIQGWRFLPPK